MDWNCWRQGFLNVLAFKFERYNKYSTVRQTGLYFIRFWQRYRKFIIAWKNVLTMANDGYPAKFRKELLEYKNSTVNKRLCFAKVFAYREVSKVNSFSRIDLLQQAIECWWTKGLKSRYKLKPGIPVYNFLLIVHLIFF